MILIVDGNNNLYRAYYKFGQMSNLDGLASGCVYGFLTITRGLLHKFNPDKVYIVFDGGRDPARMELHPGYKVREKRIDFDPDSFFSQRDDIERIMKALGIKTIRERYFEADDLIYALCKKHKGEEIVIASRDKDFNQLISPKVRVWDGHNQVLLKKSTLYGRLGYTPKECVDYLVLDGDKSDRIPGAPGFGPATIRKFLDEFGSIKRFLRKGGDFGKKGEGVTWELYNRNRALIDLRHHYRKHLSKRDLSFLDQEVKVKPNSKKAKAILFKYEIKLMFKPDFVNTFKRYAEK